MKNMMIKITTIMLFVIGFNCSLYAQENADDESYDSIQEYGCKVCGDCSSVDEIKKIWDKYEKKISYERIYTMFGK